MRTLRQIHAHFLKTPSHSPHFAISKLLAFSALYSIGNIGYARHLFGQIPHPKNLFSWNSLIRGCSLIQNPSREPISLYKELVQSGHPKPNTFTLAFVLKACSVMSSFTQGRQIHSHDCKFGLDSNPFVQTGLLTFYAKCEEIPMARSVFDGIPDKNLITWRALISGYARIGMVNEALDLFRGMQEVRIEPDEVTMVSVISACAKAGALDLGRWVHAFIERKGVRVDLVLSTTLIDMYAKYEEIEKARRVFDGMENRDTKAWSSMVVGLEIHGLVNDVLGLFSRMLDMKVRMSSAHSISNQNMTHGGEEEFEEEVGDENMSRGGEEEIEEEVGDEAELSTQIHDSHHTIQLHVGMSFKSIGDAATCYRDYGRMRGFSTKRRSTYKTEPRSEDITAVVFSCSCEGSYKGKHTSDDIDKQRRRTSTIRSGCDAKMRIRRMKRTELWEVTIFVDEHNHAMVTPSKRILMRSQRCFPTAAKSLTKSFSENNIPVSKIPSLFGGSSNVGFDKRDIWNHSRTLRQSYSDGDAEGVKEYFKKMSAENPHFFYAIQCDSDGRASNFFWVDARSRIAYSQFGDAITFDTTYRTNRYCMPFAPFTGVNHHRQSILFGCALLQNEVEDTFIWLFETWLEAMGGKAPISIITDQDLAMRAAIAKVFPLTRHRLCLWHIKKKFGEKLAHVFFKKSEFKIAIKRCTRYAHSIEDFEVQWGSLIRKYSLEDNEWLNGLYEIRKSWIPIYCRDTFFAGMNTTQRSESINNFFNGFVDSNTNLSKFVEKYDKAMESIYVSERNEDFISIHKKRILNTKDLILEYAANTYTRNMFEKFLVEWNDVCRLGVDETDVAGDVHTYMVSYKLKKDEVWQVTYNLRTMEGNCICQLFEFFGIPCRHLIKVFDRLNYGDIPPYFIMKRWKKDANRVKAIDRNGFMMHDSHVGFQASRVSDLCLRSTQLAYMAGGSDSAYEIVSKYLDKAYEEVNEYLIREGGNNATGSISAGSVAEASRSSSRVERLLLDPHFSQTKGRKRNIQGSVKEPRLKSGLELATEKKKVKPRICKACGGNGHDSRNCKKKAEQ